MTKKILNKQISRKVLETLDNIGWSKYKLQKETNIPRSSLYFMLDCKNDWSLEHLIKVLQVLKISFDEIVFETEDYIKAKLYDDNKKLNEELYIVREKVASYEIAAKDFLKKVKPKS